MYFYLLFALFSLINGQLSPPDSKKHLDRAKSIRVKQRLRPQTTELTDEWAKQAAEILWKEREAMEKTSFIPFSYEGAPSVNLLFKDESQHKTGSHYHRSMWKMIMWAIHQGHITSKTHVFDGSIGGNSAISLAYFTQLIGVKCTVVVPNEMPRSKFKKIMSFGARGRRSLTSNILDFARNETIKSPDGFFLNSIAFLSLVEDVRIEKNPPLRSIALYDELMEQLTENRTQMDYFVSTIGTGSLISSVGRSALLSLSQADIVAVDSQFSSYFDFAVSGLFAEESPLSVWIPPGLAEVGMIPFGPVKLGNDTSFRADLVDTIMKIPDMAAMSAMTVLRSKGINSGPATAANFLASLIVAATNTRVQNLLTIVTVIVDSGDLYEDTYYDREWISTNFARFGGLETYDCWNRAIEESLTTGWNPLNIGFDRGCPVDKFW